MEKSLEAAALVSNLVLRLQERRKILWSAPDKEGVVHQLVNGDDLAGAVYALSAYAHNLAGRTL